MFKEFNVEFQNVEMIGGADNLLENTKVTKVVMSGDNKMSSLDSTFKNCSELDNIQGELNLNDVSDIDNILEDTELVKRINLKNVNNENISADNSFPNVEEISIGGGSYNKKAIQNVIASKDWAFDNINYSGIVGDNIVTKEVNVIDDNKLTIKDTLEQKARGFEVIGQTYENLVVGNGEVTLLDELTLESIDGTPNEFTPHIEQPVCVEVVEGNTVQDESNIYSIGELQEDGTYKIDILTHNKGYKAIDLIDNSKYSWNAGYIMQGDGFRSKDEYIDINILKNNNILICSNGYYNLEFIINFYDSNFELTDTNYKRLSVNQISSTKLLIYYKSEIPSNALYFRWCSYSGTNSISSYNIKCYYVDKSISDFSDIYSYIESTQSILLPHPLRKIGDVKDKLYWDEDKGHYCIEQNVSKELEVMASPNIIDLPHLNKKYSLDTYMPTTYLQCVDTAIQPSRVLLETDIVKYKPVFLDPNREYQVKFECKEKGNDIKLKLGGTEKSITPIVGENTVSITTPQEITDSRLCLYGANNKLSDIYVIADNMSTGELQEDRSYRVGIKSNEGFNVSIISNNPLGKADKLYWNKSNKRYEIDRSGVIEVPTVSGDVIDLPRLYQSKDTVLAVESGNINPSNIKVEYLDIG